MGSHPRATVLQDKPAARGAVVSSGNSHVPQCKSCGEPCGSSGPIPSTGCREPVLHWSHAQGSRGISPLMPAVLSPLLLPPCCSQGCSQLHSAAFCHFSAQPLLQLQCSQAQRLGQRRPFTCTVSGLCSCLADTGNTSTLEQCRKNSKNQTSLHTKPSPSSHGSASEVVRLQQQVWQSGTGNPEASAGLRGSLWDPRAKTVGAAEARRFL